MNDEMRVRFDSSGELMVGIYPLTSSEIVALFGQGDARREQLGRVFQEMLGRIRACGVVRRCWIGGSFASQKAVPGDIDLWLLVTTDSDAITLSPAFSDLFAHERAKLVYGADVFWMTEAGAAVMLEQVLECLQTTRDGRPRGIIEVKL
ncbi:MAG TPA: hypothetical protein VI454_08260 [Verrucomicrobiae bacterium]